MTTFFDYLKEKKYIQKKAQKVHDQALREYQDNVRDFGYINFIDPRTNKHFQKIFLLARYEDIDRNLIPILYDNRQKYGMYRYRTMCEARRD